MRIAIVSSPSAPVITLGRFSIAPTQRMPTCGWLMIGVPISDPKTPGIRDREGAVLHLARIEPLRARAIREVVERSRESGQRQIVGVLDHRDDQAPVERDRDADVDLLAVDDLVAAHGGVEHRDAL